MKDSLQVGRSVHAALPPLHQLAAGSLYVAAAAAAHGDEAAELVEAGGEGLEALLAGFAEGRVGVLVHGNQVDVVAEAEVAQPVDQAVGVVERVVDSGEEHVLEDEALVALERPGVERLAQPGEVP